MDNSNGNPPPPGVQSLPYSASPASSGPLPQHFGHIPRPHEQFFQHHMNHGFHVPPGSAPHPHPQSLHPHTTPPSQFNAPPHPQFHAQMSNNYPYGNGITPPMPSYQPLQQLSPITSNFHGVQGLQAPYYMNQPLQSETGAGTGELLPSKDVGNSEKVTLGTQGNERQEVLQDNGISRTQPGVCMSEPSNVHQNGSSTSANDGKDQRDGQSNAKVEAIEGTAPVDVNQKHLEIDTVTSEENQGKNCVASFRYPQQPDDEIETAAQAAVLREQEIATLKIIQSQRFFTSDRRKEQVCCLKTAKIFSLEIMIQML